MMQKKHITIGICFTTLVIGFGILFAAFGIKTQTQAQSATSFTFTAAGDHANGAAFKATLDQVKTAGASFHIALGDNSYSGGSETAWCNEFVTRGLSAVLITGNHDARESGGGNIEVYKTKPGCTFPFSAMTGNYAHQYYFNYPQTGVSLARFIFIRPGIGGNGPIDYSVNQPGYIFTRDAIDSAKAAGIKWIIVAMHKNCISTGQKSCEVGSDIFNLLIQKKVDAILQGHDHNYQRSHSLSCFTIDTVNANCIADNGNDAMYAKGAGSVVVVSGTGGQGLYGVNAGDSETGYFAAMNGDTHGATKFTINANSITASSQFLRSSGGTFTDSFTITDCLTCPKPTTTPPPPVDLADLIVTDISWIPATPVVDSPVTFKATIKNQGTSSTPQGTIHGVRFSIDGVLGPWSDIHITSIPPGDSVTLTATGGPSGATLTATAGIHTILAHVDDVDQIAESNATNNTLQKTLTVATSPNTPVAPTQTNPTVSGTPLPTVFLNSPNGYECVIDPKCSQTRTNLQLCRLICTPK